MSSAAAFKGGISSAVADVGVSGCHEREFRANLRVL